MGSLPSRRLRSPIQTDTVNSHQPAQRAMNKYAAVALYNFPSGGLMETIIRRGEQLNVLSEDGNWWKVISLASGNECYMPSNYVAKVFHRWLYEGISREKAEELLLLACNQGGSFLIRKSQTRKGCYSLSIRRTQTPSWDAVKHYRIHRLENGWVFISPRLTFSSLQHLVDYYSEVEDGLCCLLKAPCFLEGSRSTPVQNLPEPLVIKTPALNWKDLDSSVLFKDDKAVDEESPVSLGLREAVSSYMYMTEGLGFGGTADKGNRWRTC
ncbi:src-like-adapter 2 [Rhinatrema bivittatum]|uniref:src-like-adapter 2 n=1 Tax=Rhinatrema bivittatum TaxID=194408 RepID=UPI0011295236|nr:src-like-adapter 2 [Rhinatrema bivittatum]XP_029470544.1 src-like-adapter 2 [Rhinatrema bivittatum]